MLHGRNAVGVHTETLCFCAAHFSSLAISPCFREKQKTEETRIVNTHLECANVCDADQAGEGDLFVKGEDINLLQVSRANPSFIQWGVWSGVFEELKLIGNSYASLSRMHRITRLLALVSDTCFPQ